MREKLCQVRKRKERKKEGKLTAEKEKCVRVCLYVCLCLSSGRYVTSVNVR